MPERAVRAARVLLAAAMILPLLAAPSLAAEAPRMDPAALKALLGSPDVVVVDVRVEGATADTRIPGAVIEDSAGYAGWSKKYPMDKTIVLYCSWHEEGTSARVALRLIEMGYGKAYALKGGWYEWLKLGYPVEKK